MTLPLKRPVSEGRLVRKYVKKKPKRLAYNQFYCKGGHWREISPIIYPSSHINIGDVETKLKELGYPIIVNYVVDPEDKEALKDFRKKNNIKSDYLLDFQTLRALGLR